MSEPSLEGLDEQELLGELPSSVARNLSELDTQGAAWDQIGNLLAAAPAAGVSLKGGGAWTGKLWVATKGEFYSFLCTESEPYIDLRKEWVGLRKKGSAVAVASLSGVIGAQLGVASGVIAPLAIWAIVVALRIGKESVCSAFAPQTEEPSADASPA